MRLNNPSGCPFHQAGRRMRPAKSVSLPSRRANKALARRAGCPPRVAGVTKGDGQPKGGYECRGTTGGRQFFLAKKILANGSANNLGRPKKFWPMGRPTISVGQKNFGQCVGHPSPTPHGRLKSGRRRAPTRRARVPGPDGGGRRPPGTRPPRIFKLGSLGGVAKLLWSFCRSAAWFAQSSISRSREGR